MAGTASPPPCPVAQDAGGVSPRHESGQPLQEGQTRLHADTLGGPVVVRAGRADLQRNAARAPRMIEPSNGLTAAEAGPPCVASQGSSRPRGDDAPAYRRQNRKERV